MSLEIHITLERILLGFAYQDFYDDIGKGTEISIGFFFVIISIFSYED